ncbi:hypothetical protein LPY66_11320 [Dehalobacter sp. DCM]|uniref:hypothetical protein n=1 Tax=Dehalobacter sp. DCM TaxID=2907827 RepID=UPI003081F556|nr:hypothetical protein LPY66_11320 [Dehalobacter sp. DCM]
MKYNFNGKRLLVDYEESSHADMAASMKKKHKGKDLSKLTNTQKLEIFNAYVAAGLINFGG